jgi:hypothetical protein
MTISKIDDLLATEITWQKTAGKAEWSATVGGEDCRLKMNNFPAEPLYTLSWRGESLDLDDAPKRWRMPRTIAPRAPKIRKAS